jgi:hypothetical protein
MSVVRLDRVEGLTLHIRESDMLDGTPVLDLKPYVAYTDSHPEAGAGWLEGGGCGGRGSPRDPIDAYAVELEPVAAQQAAWIEAQTGLDIATRIRSTLALGPEPHPYRRIRRLGEGMQLAVKEWRVRFSVADRLVRVLEIRSGFRASQLAIQNSDPAVVPHRQFTALWPAKSS